MKKKLNILHIHDARYVSGIERGLFDTFKYLNRDKFNLYFLGSLQSDGRFIEKAKELNVMGKNIRMGSISITINPFKIVKFFYDFLLSNIVIARIIKQKKIDVIITHSLLDCLNAYLACIVTGKNMIWHEHDTLLPHKFKRLAVKIIDKKINCYTAISKEVKRHLIRLGVKEHKIIIIYNAVNLKKFDELKYVNKINLRKKWNLPQDSFLVGLVGYIAPNKGHKTFIRSAELVIKEIPQTRFLIIGARKNDSYEKELEKMINRLRLQKSVIFTDWIENIESVYFELNVVVLATETEEPFGRIIIESAAAYRPVVATCVGAAPEVIVDSKNGLLVPRDDHSMMAVAIVKILKNPELAAEMAKKGRENVEKRFSLDIFIHNMEHLYENI